MRLKLFLSSIFLFIGVTLLMAQPSYDACSNALVLCPQSSYSVTNVGATQTGYTYGEDDFNFCFIPKKTIWIKFETNTNGGKVTIDLTTLAFSTPTGSGLNFSLLKQTFPCDGSTYSNDTCISNIQTATSIQLDSLDSLTTYYICLAGVDNGGVVSEFNTNITISGPGVNRIAPSLSIAPSKTIFCENEEIIITAYLGDCPNSGKFRWYRNGQLFAISDSSFIHSSTLKNGDVLSVENSCFQYCVDSLQAVTAPLTVKSVNLQVSNDTIISNGDRVLLQCFSSVDSLWWEPSYLVQNSDSVFTYGAPLETTTFYANAYMDGCLVSRPILVTVLESIVIFNTFSPNGDGINDKWIIEGIENYPNAEVSVFTRWGQRVYFMMGYNKVKAWDGTDSGRKLAAGTYFYTIDLKDNADSKIIKGAINLIR